MIYGAEDKSVHKKMVNVGIQLILDTLLTNLEILLVGLSFLGSLLFATKDFKFVPMISLGLNSALFIWFYNAGLNFTIPLYGLLLSFVGMVLLIIPSSNTSTTGGLT